MRRAYILIYSTNWTQDQVKDYIDSLREIINWRADLPNTFYLVSENSADELATLFRKFTKDQGTFLISEISENKQGWLSKETWDMMIKKNAPGEK